MQKESVFKKIQSWFKKRKEKSEKKYKDMALDEYYKNLYAKKEVIYPNELIDHEVVKRFYFLPATAKIDFRHSEPFLSPDEKEYFKKLKEIFKILGTQDKYYKIKISVDNRELLKQSGLLEHTKNIELTINNDYYNYTKDEYLSEEEQLESLIEPIRNSNLSPYEKYLAVYNIVKQFKEYKENGINRSEARQLRYILNNDYMVCVGYANLLTTLLDKVGIPCKTISLFVSTYYINPFVDESMDKDLLGFTSYQGHERNLVKIDDDKYNIHGIYVADATWDNNLKIDLYNNASTTFDKRKCSEEYEAINKYDCLLDFHSFEEYCEKINFHLKRKINSSDKKTYKEKLIYAYYFIYREIMEILYKLDYQKWQYFCNKYYEVIKTANKDYKHDVINIKEYENILSDFLTEYGNYILTLSNNEIDINTTYNAAKEVKRLLDGLSEEELNPWLDNTAMLNKPFDQTHFPYIYDPSEDKKHMLEERTDILVRVRKRLH